METRKKQQRLTTEKKINNDIFRVKVGTVNKSNPQVIYFEGRTFISPNFEEDSYSYTLLSFRKYFSSIISEEIANCDLFEKRFILDFQVANSGVRVGKKSFLSFQLLLKQPNNSIKDLKDVVKLSGLFINNILFKLKSFIIDNDFSISKTKKESFMV